MNHNHTATYVKVDKTQFIAINSTVEVYVSDRKPRGDKFYLYAEHGKHSGWKSEQRRQQIKKELQTPVTPTKRINPFLRDRRIEWEAEHFFVNLCRAKHIKITEGAEFNTRVGREFHRGKLLMTGEGDIVFKEDNRNKKLNHN